MARRLAFSQGSCVLVSMLSMLLVVFMGLSGAVHAKGTANGSASADPTRPPAILTEEEPNEDASKKEPPPSGLQTVILRKGAKPLAIINGQTVKLGEKVGDARLVSLSETQAILQGPDGREVLRLMPAAERKAVIPPQPRKDSKRGGKHGKRKKILSKSTK